MPLGWFGDRDGLEGFLLLHLRRGFAGAARGIRFLPCSCAGAGSARRAFRRQAGGDVFRALDFVLVALLVNLFDAADDFAHGFGAGLRGFAVVFLLALTQSATGAETHSAAASAEKFLSLMLIPFSIDVNVLQQAHGDQRAEH